MEGRGRGRGGHGVPDEKEPKIFLEEPRCEWEEWPPEGAPVPNNTHSEQVGDTFGLQESLLAPSPKETAIVTLAGCIE